MPTSKNNCQKGFKRGKEHGKAGKKTAKTNLLKRVEKDLAEMGITELEMQVIFNRITSPGDVSLAVQFADIKCK